MAEKLATRVLFVCMGNICRSPTAEGVFRARAAARGVEHHFEIDSAGTHAYHVGNPPDPRSIEAAARRGIDLKSIRARKVTAEDLERFDLVLAMDVDNHERLLGIARETHAGKVRLFLEYGESGRREVPDPYYGGANGFEEVLDLIEEAADGLLNELLAQSP